MSGTRRFQAWSHRWVTRPQLWRFEDAFLHVARIDFHLTNTQAGDQSEGWHYRIAIGRFTFGFWA